jgi:hypothetical protein
MPCTPILRIPATREGEQAWQAWLQNTATGQRQGFPNLESLFDFLAASKDEKKGAQTENRTGRR